MVNKLRIILVLNAKNNQNHARRIWATKHRTGEQGMIFRELVDDLDPSIDPNTVFSWFHPNCTKNEAVDMLVKAGPGSFLVRPSDNSPGDYSLFFHINNQIQRFRIEKKGVRYLMGGRTFVNNKTFNKFASI